MRGGIDTWQASNTQPVDSNSKEINYLATDQLSISLISMG
jgi:hypothetical protein